MSKLKLVVSNDDKPSIRSRVLKALISHQGKEVSVFCAIRDISVEDLPEAFKALDELVEAGLVARNEIMNVTPNGKLLTYIFYRYRSENNLYRNPDLKVVH